MVERIVLASASPRSARPLRHPCPASTGWNGCSSSCGALAL